MTKLKTNFSVIFCFLVFTFI